MLGSARVIRSQGTLPLSHYASNTHSTQDLTAYYLLACVDAVFQIVLFERVLVQKQIELKSSDHGGSMPRTSKAVPPLR